jgi:hypothetical protein
MNPRLSPCGGTKTGRTHLDAFTAQKVQVIWKVVQPDPQGNCTIRIGGGVKENDFQELYYTNGSKLDKGKFPCGRSQNMIETKEI